MRHQTGPYAERSMTCFVSNARTNCVRKALVGALCPTRSASRSSAPFKASISVGRPASMSRSIDGIAFANLHLIPSVVMHRAGLRIRCAEATGDADEEVTPAQDAFHDLLTAEAVLDREHRRIFAEHWLHGACGGLEVAHLGGQNNEFARPRLGRVRRSRRSHRALAAGAGDVQAVLANRIHVLAPDIDQPPVV